MSFILFIRNQYEKNYSPTTHYFASLEARGHISHGKFCATFSEFKVHIFLWNVLLFLLVIFWKIVIDTYILWRKYMLRTFKCTCTDLYQKIFIFQTKTPCLVPINNYFLLWCWNMFSFSSTDWSCKCPYWVHSNVNFSSHM